MDQYILEELYDEYGSRLFWFDVHEGDVNIVD